jgi:hypothetical protein
VRTPPPSPPPSSPPPPPPPPQARAPRLHDVNPVTGPELLAVRTTAGGGMEWGWNNGMGIDGTTAGTRFDDLRGMVRLPGGRVLVADGWNDRIRMLGADL